MSVLPQQKMQCDRCRTVHVLTANKSEHWRAELHAAGWRARPVRGVYKHACNLCAAEFLADFEGRRSTRAA
jgi:hypothetical protein